jgi:riboflavin synthase
MGACLTVTQRNGDCFEADLSEETLQKTTLGRLAAGSGLHLEPALLVGEPLDGHFVLGHVDCVGALLARPKDEGIWRFSVPPWMAPMLAPKGCIAVDGISLTVVDAFSDSFSVALIPETVSNTMLKDLSPGSKVNIEADPLGRYAVRFLSLSLKNEKLGKFASDGWGAVEG